MSKVKIQGNASGTGVLTITAPNTSTDRTITLPDATGTLLNSDGSGANLTSLPNGSQLDHSGTKKIEATATGVSVTGATNSTVMPTLNSVSIVDSGSNSNGAYTKWADGTMICTHKLVSSSSAAVQWTYPVAFVSGNVPAFAGTNSGVSPDADGGRILTNASESRTNTYVKFFAFMLSNGGRSTSSFQMSAIGRWS